MGFPIGAIIGAWLCPISFLLVTGDAPEFMWGFASGVTVTAMGWIISNPRAQRDDGE